MTRSSIEHLRKAAVPKTFRSMRELAAVLFLCAMLLVWGSPSGAQTDDDDDDMSGGALAVLLLAVGGAVAGDIGDLLPPSSQMHLDDLRAAIDEAANAEMAEDRARELKGLGKATGAARALLGMAASCDECEDLQDDLQEILGIIARERARIAGTPRSCRPDGVISKWEECDPLARPTGCETIVDATFCDVDCKCEPVP